MAHTFRFFLLSLCRLPFFSFRWRARRIVKNIPPSDMAEVRAKVAAMSPLSGERVDWGYNRAWEGDYLANVSLYLSLLPFGYPPAHLAAPRTTWPTFLLWLLN